mgnify:CR=1 FL=1
MLTERWGFSLPDGYEILDVENWRFRHKNRPIRFHVWTLKGILEVTDAGKFIETLKNEEKNISFCTMESIKM